MRVLLVLIIATYLNYSLAGERDLITCSDIVDHVTYVPILDWLITDKEKYFDIFFYLSTNRNKRPMQIGLDKWSWVSGNGFNMSKKTFIITHGWMSGGEDPWCLQLKDALLEARDSNVIMVDWSDGSYLPNYVSAARNTIIVAERIYNSLQNLHTDFLELNPDWSGEILGNHLHFIGHSLGAQISGQTAHLLKNDSFWKVERITGLDPANPCFSNVDPSLRIDREHADFVDVYHTQISLEFSDGVGMPNILGHVDFYLNGGIIQPECQDVISIINDVLYGSPILVDFIGSSMKLKKMKCSHSLATEYFIAALNNTKTRRCTFPVYDWDGSFSDAQRGIQLYVLNRPCIDCPKMGMNAVNSKRRGMFLVLTSSEQPYCELTEEDIETCVAGMEKLTEIKSIFDHDRLNDNSLFIDAMKWLYDWFKPKDIWTRVRMLSDVFHKFFSG